MSRLFLGLAALALLSACGIKSGLERPDPLWNAQGAIAHECARERAYNAEHPAHPRALDRRCGQPQGEAQDTSPQPPQSPTAPRP
ncbi:MAG: hypothetical protein JSS00_07970 [Proteobacteria bacterium]|nr:hypothetical protein [Pseudomonadota bacterium]